MKRGGTGRNGHEARLPMLSTPCLIWATLGLWFDGRSGNERGKVQDVRLWRYLGVLLLDFTLWVDLVDLVVLVV